MHDQRVDGVHRRFGLAARLRFVLGGGTRRFLRPITGVDRPRQCQPVVTLIDRFMRLLKSSGGFGIAFWRVLFGAGRLCGVDCLLRLIDFFLGRCRTGRGERDRARDRAQQGEQARHQHESIAGYGVR